MTDALLERNIQETAVHSGDEDVRQYIRDIRQYPLLTPEREVELAKRCASGDSEAIHQMISSNLRLVVTIAREYSGQGVPLLDLIQEGSMGLMEAAKGFDYTQGYRFSTYAGRSIRNRMIKTLSSDAGVIRVTAYTAERIRKLMNVRKNFLTEQGREPELSDLARQMELPVEKVEELLRLSPEISSLDVAVGENGAVTVGNLIASDGAWEPQAVLIRQEMKEILESMLAKLNERQQRILRLRFGLDDGVAHSLVQIGAMLGISKERVRQIEHQAIRRMNQLGAELGLEDFLG